MSYGNSDGSDGSSAGGYGSDSSSSSSAGGYGSDSSSSSSAGGYGGDGSSNSSSGSCGDDSSSSSSSGNFGSDSSSSSSNDDSNSNSSGVNSTSDNSDNSDSGSSLDSSNVSSNSSATAENNSSIDSSSSLTGAQLDGSAGNSLNPSEGIVGGTPCSEDLGGYYNSNTYNGISLDGTAGATLASSEPATAYSFTGYISDSYDSTVASSYQSTMDMSGFQNTEVTESSLVGSAWNSLTQWADQSVVQPLQEVYNDYVSQPLNNMQEAYQMAMSTTVTLPSAGEVASQLNEIADGTSGGVQVQVDNDNHLAIVDPDGIQKQYSTDADLVEGLVDGKITIDDVQKTYDTEGIVRDYDPNRDRIDYLSASIGASAWKSIGGNVNITMDVNGHIYAGGSLGPGEGPVTPVAVSLTQGRIDMDGIKADPDAVRNFCDGYSATAYVGGGLGGAKTVSLPSGVTATEEGFVVGIGAQGAYMQEVKAVTPEEFQEKIQGWESDLQEIQSDIPSRQSSYLNEGDIIEALDSGKATWNELDINGVLKDSR